jgi:predicted nucleic acid-binding protein
VKSQVVIDANIGLALALPLPYSPKTVLQMNHWQNEGTELFVPTLWIYEVITAMRKSVTAKVISSEKAEEALEWIFALDIQPISPTKELYRNIFHWATRLNQSQAYDAVYLALAEQLGIDFWTADQRLANRTKQLKLTWVHNISETIE